MRKQSMMGSSKYEYHPEQFDVDIVQSQKKRKEKKAKIRDQVQSMIADDPVLMNETFSMYIEVLREIKEQYNI